MAARTDYQRAYNRGYQRARGAGHPDPAAAGRAEVEAAGFALVGRGKGERRAVSQNGRAAVSAPRAEPAAGPAPGVAAESVPKDVPPKRKRPGGAAKTLTQAQRTAVRAALRRALDAPNMAFTLARFTGAQVPDRYFFAPPELDELADVWADVAALYPQLYEWFGQGEKAAVWGRALFVTTMLLIPRVGIDLAQRSGLATTRAREEYGANGSVAAPVPEDVAGASGAGGYPDPAGGARPAGGDDGQRQDDLSPSPLGLT
jgi:hypothetical protein